MTVPAQQSGGDAAMDGITVGVAGIVEAGVAEIIGGEQVSTTPGYTINDGRQGRHIVGHDNFVEGRSEITVDPVELLSRLGTGQQVGDHPVGDPGSRERIDFGREIGIYVDLKGGRALPRNSLRAFKQSRGLSCP